MYNMVNISKMNKCKNCSVDIPNGRKFCGSSCAATYNNKIYPKRTQGRKKPKCLGCGNEIDGRYNRKYCSNKCQGEIKGIKLLQNWLEGKAHHTKNGIASFQRKYLLEKHNYKCSECGWGETNQYSGLTSLEIDHIDGNAYNNDINNLKVLCPNCHSLTKTYKNIGSRTSARTWRKKAS
jgi:predicted nucleic acid-binding Zn ribbon protein